MFYMNDITNLKKELDVKIHNLFKDNEAYLEYLLQTKNNFLYRYLETSDQKHTNIESLAPNTLVARSFESNMGDAFKISDPEIKEGIKNLAKSIPREQRPTVQYSLKTILEDLRADSGKITIESSVNWNFPTFEELKGQYKIKRVTFFYNDPNLFRKELALKYEDACELFN